MSNTFGVCYGLTATEVSELEATLGLEIHPLEQLRITQIGPELFGISLKEIIREGTAFWAYISASPEELGAETVLEFEGIEVINGRWTGTANGLPWPEYSVERGVFVVQVCQSRTGNGYFRVATMDFEGLERCNSNKTRFDKMLPKKRKELSNTF